MTKAEHDKIYHLIRTGTPIWFKNQFETNIYCILKEAKREFVWLSMKEIEERMNFYKSNRLGYFPNEIEKSDCIVIYNITSIFSKDNIINDILEQYFPDKQIILLSIDDFDIKNSIDGVSIDNWNSHISLLYPSHPKY